MSLISSFVQRLVDTHLELSSLSLVVVLLESSCHTKDSVSNTPINVKVEFHRTNPSVGDMLTLLKKFSTFDCTSKLFKSHINLTHLQTYSV